VRRILLSFDGLGIQDVPELLHRLPKTRRFVETAKLIPLDTGVLRSSQAIWAELLTGEPWHRNGCYGYAHPCKSLNELEISNEKDLYSRVQLLKNEAKQSRSVLINVPLLKPNSSSRVWLSDGSFPTNILVSPSELLRDASFQEYKPHAYSHVAGVLGIRNIMAYRCVESEQLRLSCTLNLLSRTDWQRAIWRVSLFDELSHLIGLRFLGAEDLRITETLQHFLNALDDGLSQLFEQSQIEIFIISSYSHEKCLQRLNLNKLLAHGRFLTIDYDVQEFRDGTQRVAAMSAIREGTTGPALMRSSEGRLRTAATQAASPVYGCVLINSRVWFEDGLVDAAEHAATSQHVYVYLKKILDNRFGAAAKIEVNPQPLSERTGRPCPELIISIDGVDLIDVEDPGLLDTFPPRTMHSPSGFLAVPAKYTNSPDLLKPTQLVEILNEF